MDSANAAYQSNLHNSDTRTTTGSGWRWRLGGLVLLILGAAALGAWGMWRYAGDPVDEAPKVEAAPRATLPAAVARPVTAAPPALPYPAVTPGEAGAMTARMALLEERLARITLSADAAAGNAAKAEALLVALAARRAVDRGRPLGAMEAQLQRLFGDSQPVAVASIITVARSPVSQGQLLARLDALRPQLMTVPSASLLERIGKGLSSLVVIRADTTASPQPQQRFTRARLALLADELPLAIMEIEAMPGARDPAVTAWLTLARQRNDASRALDLIEAAAVVEPGSNRGVSNPAIVAAP